jgi:hypothetical protein
MRAGYSLLRRTGSFSIRMINVSALGLIRANRAANFGA